MKSNNLTLVAALPMGGGCMSSLPAEKNEQPVKVQMKAPYFDHLEFPPIEVPPTIEELAQKYLDAHEGLDA